MKLHNALTAIALTGALSIGTASAMGLASGTKPLASVLGGSAPSVSVNIQDGVATLFGNVESNSEAQLAKTYVQNIYGVDRVIKLVTFN